MRILLKIMTLVLAFIYGLIKFFTPVRNKITFISRQDNSPSCDFMLLEKEMKKKHPEIRIVMLCKTLDKSPIGLVSYAFHMLSQMRHIAGSKAVILDSYCIAASLLKHKKELVIVQIWHSMGTMKEFGYTAMCKAEGASRQLAKAMKMHENYDYVFISSDAYKQDMAEGFNCDINRIYTMPLPRLDLLKSATYTEAVREKIYAEHPNLREKKNILYCPTFRKDDESGLQWAVDALVDRIDQQRYNLIVKLHPLSKVQIKNAHVTTANGFSTFDMLFAADYVISDYSCVIYEAAVRSIPLYFFCFDFDQYEDNRGLAIDIRKECPGVISENINDIIDAIEAETYEMDYLRAFADKYVYPTKHAASDMADFIFRVIK